MPAAFTYERIREYELPVAEVWRMLVHTERLHQMAALSPVVYGDPPEEGGSWRSAWVKGIPRSWLRWREHPFDWVRERSLCVLREFEAGPVTRYLRGVILEPTSTGTRVRAFVECTPRWGLLSALVRWRARRWCLSVHRYCTAFLLLHRRRGEYVIPQKANHFVRLLGWERRLRAFAAATPGASLSVARLKHHLTHGTDEEVTHMRPKVLAEAWGLPPGDVCRLFLHGAAEGLLRMEWVVQCPCCRYPLQAFDSLAAVPSRARCVFCRLTFDLDLEQALELRFSVHASIRLTVETPLHRPGPADLPHVVIQRFLPPGAAAVLPAEWGDERFHCRVLRTNEPCRLSATLRHSSRPTRVPVTFTDSGWVAEGVLFRPGRQELELRNDSARPVVVAVERAEAGRGAFTGLEAITDTDFRNLFPLEAPAPGRRLFAPSLSFLVVSVRNFTDHLALKGDRPALRDVQAYLASVVEAVTAEGGAVLKIHGDVVLATFLRGERAVAAAFRILESAAPPFVLNIGLHRGPALVLSRGRQLDCFGEAVSRAFQLQKESVGGDFVMSQALFEDPAVQQVLLNHRFDQEPREVLRNGPSGGFRICQILPLGKAG